MKKPQTESLRQSLPFAAKRAIAKRAIAVATLLGIQSIAIAAAEQSKPITNAEVKVETPATSAVPPPPALKPHPRAEAQDRIGKTILQSMMASEDPRALALSAKFARTAGMSAGEPRKQEEQDAIQEALLAKAFKMIAEPQHKSADGFVRYAVASFCLGFPDRKLCAEKDRVLELANLQMSNAIPWLMVASREFSQGRNLESQVFLERATTATSVNWYFREAMEVANQYARKAKEIDDNFADAAVVTFNVGGETTIPDYKRYTQMCNPNPEGKLPDGRYEACRKVAALLINLGETNIDAIVAIKALERMALGEKKENDAKRHNTELAEFQAGISRLWKIYLKYPPTTPAEASLITTFVSDLVTSGERAATVTAQKKFFVADKPSEKAAASTK